MLTLNNKDQYNKSAVDKHFQIGQKVIVLIPDSTNKFLCRWQRPGTVVSVKLPYSYLVELEQGQCRWLHANRLRPYHARVNALIGKCAIVYESDEEFGTLPVITPEHVDLVACLQDMKPPNSKKEVRHIL